GVTVNNIAPGVILTGRSRGILADPVYAAKVMDQIPMSSFGKPEDIAELALLLCGDRSRYITGADIPVDGGMHL
ncbi:MAG: short-chain dehydrogenase, partial [Verrucomicrobiales bacterium VVV1]